ncbi:MAG: imidazole glycerol phosphate synthase subunit HisH [SAR86 cluster bacterium]|jgi:glutamine amidotransferase|nr:imidazole glycerol phosphate synthase subunit HisH [SAR86 cluster bacterium]|tara:strand:- start:5149 stop:5760 length:612 start_codon:yes stop_codon:yes gene_type:complete
MTQVVVIDYGMGNLHSVSKALETVADSEKIIISSDLGVIKASDKIVFPGVGAIKDCMAAFSEDLKETVLEEIGKKPTLAICVGMQMLLESSEENEGVNGLNILDGKVTKIKSLDKIKVPHMGWNKVKFLKDHFLFKNIPDSSFFYFVHSYCCLSSEDALTETEHGENFISSLAKDNIFAVQFHPEKSQTVGLDLYKNFLDWSI